MLEGIHVVHVVADQERSSCAVARYWYRMKVVWSFVLPIAHARTRIPHAASLAVSKCYLHLVVN